MMSFILNCLTSKKELGHYKKHFKNKIVFCNCDDPEESNFWHYFAENFEYLGLKKLVSTHFEKDKPSYKLEIVKDINKDGKINKLDTIKTSLKQNGDFRSPECIEILKEANIVVTNPPFSLFREYVAQLIAYKKKFIIIGNVNAITYKEIFKLIKNNKLWLGHQRLSKFRVPADCPLSSSITVDQNGIKYGGGASIWFTNLNHNKRHEDLTLYKVYDKKEYPKYDKYNAINIDNTKNIPTNYKKTMGVPITFLEKYNPKQFEIIDGIGRYSMLTGPTKKTKGTYLTEINGKLKYARIIIKNKKL